KKPLTPVAEPLPTLTLPPAAAPNAPILPKTPIESDVPDSEGPDDTPADTEDPAPTNTPSPTCKQLAKATQALKFMVSTAGPAEIDAQRRHQHLPHFPQVIP